MNRAGYRAFLHHSVVFIIGDIALFFGALAISLYVRDPLLATHQVFLSFFPLFCLWICAFYSLGLYESPIFRDLVSLTESLLGSVITCWIFGSTYFYILSPYLGLTPKTHLLITILISHLGIFGWRRMWLKVLNFQLLRQQLVILGDDKKSNSLINEMTVRATEMGFAPTQWHWPGVDIIVADPMWVELNWEKARLVISEAVSHRVPIFSLDSFYESLLGKVSPDWASRPSWAIEHVLPRTGSAFYFFKRLIDISSSCLLLLVFSPIFIFIYGLIVAIDQMPAIYGQRRIGFLGKEFTLWKFRTMRVGADEAGAFSETTSSKDQVTNLGRLLRRYRLDELPQLWNVIIGDMSLVGPRPEWVKEVDVLERVVPNYHLRHLVPPGITGWAQVYYRATNDPKDSIEKHHYDLYYLKHFSVALDITIMMKTIKRVFINDSRVISNNPSTVKKENLDLPFDIAAIINRK